MVDNNSAGAYLQAVSNPRIALMHRLSKLQRTAMTHGADLLETPNGWEWRTPTERTILTFASADAAALDYLDTLIRNLSYRVLQLDKRACA